MINSFANYISILYLILISKTDLIPSSSHLRGIFRKVELVDAGIGLVPNPWENHGKMLGFHGVLWDLRVFFMGKPWENHGIFTGLILW